MNETLLGSKSDAGSGFPDIDATRVTVKLAEGGAESATVRAGISGWPTNTDELSTAIDTVLQQLVVARHIDTCGYHILKRAINPFERQCCAIDGVVGQRRELSYHDLCGQTVSELSHPSENYQLDRLRRRNESRAGHAPQNAQID